MTDRTTGADSVSPEPNEGGRSSAPQFGEMGDKVASQPQDSSAPRRRKRRRKKATPKDDSESSSVAVQEEPEAQGGRRRRRSSSRRAKATTEEDGKSSEPEAEGESGDKPRSRSRRGRRGGRRSKRGEDDKAARTADSDATEGSEGESPREAESGGRGRRRSRTTRNRRGKADSSGAAEVELIPFEDDDLPPLKSSEAKSEGRRGRKAKKKSRRSKKSTERSDKDNDNDNDEPKSRRKQIRSKRGRKTAAEPETPKRILVNAKDREETRVAVVRDGKIVDFQMTVQSERSHVSDIYRGRVVNIEQSIGAAFIDFGRGKNGFLHTSDVLGVYGEKEWSIEKLLSVEVDPEEWDSTSSQPSITAEVEDEEGGGKGKAKETKVKKKVVKKKGGRRRFHARPRLPIKDLLKKGQMVVCQVTKDAIGDKGPTLTTYLSITGHYLVLTPNMTRKGVSRKIESVRERKRLRKILDGFELPSQLGLICRTAAKGRSAEELQRDLDGLLEHWDNFGKRLKVGRGPMLLYEEPEVAVRAVREHFDSNTEVVLVDDEKMHAELCKFADQVMPEFKDRIQLHTGNRPLFREEGMEEEFERIFARRVDLPSGGSIVLDQTEALVAIDVNSGRTRVDSHDFEEIALKTNLEAVPEVARQMRLRDFGGIIVVDFIDMMKRGNIKKVEDAFAGELAKDRARSKVGRISQFGLLEMTRERGGPGIIKKLFTNCSRCRGEGKIRTVQSRAAAILRRLQSSSALKGFSKIEVRTHADSIEYLQKFCFNEIGELADSSQRKIDFVEAPDQIEDSVLRYLRADGREVRPGGRRKR